MALRIIEARFRKYDGCTVTHDTRTGDRGTIDLYGFPTQVADAKATCYQILMTAVPARKANQYPPTWGPGPHDYELKSEQVLAGTPECRDILEKLQATIPSLQLIKLERIQRPKL